MITLRAARLYDWPDIQAMLDEAESHASREITRTTPCYVAEDVGLFVGFAMAERVDDAAILTAIGVQPGWRHTGLGSALAERLMDELFEDGVAWAFASTPAEIAPFFKQLGFEDERSELVPEKLQRRLRNRPPSNLVMSRAHSS